MARTSRKQEIVATAMELFAERGVAAVSLREINAQAKMSPAALHYHFKDRDALITEIVEICRAKFRDKRLAAAERYILCKPTEEVTMSDVANVIVHTMADHIKESPVEGLQEIRFIARLYFDGVKYLAGLFRRGWELFYPMFAKQFPHLSEDDLRIRWAMSIEFAVHSMANYEVFIKQCFGNDDVDVTEIGGNFDAYVESLVNYLTAGFEQAHIKK